MESQQAYLNEILALVLFLGVGGFAGGYIMGQDDYAKSHVVVPISEARRQLLEANVVSKSDLGSYLSDQANVYFSAHNYPLDPVHASTAIGDTIKRSQNTNHYAVPKLILPSIR